MFHPLFGNADDAIVIAINSCHSPLMDSIVLIVTDFWFFAALVCCLIAYSLRRDRYPKVLLFCALLIVAVGCTDFLCASIIRPAVHQMRPTNPDNPIHAILHIVNGYTGGKYGFPSCHAANSFAIAVLSTLWFRKKWIAAALITWALAECYTRLYLGVHYPSDILFGAAIGTLTALLTYRLSFPLRHRISNGTGHHGTRRPFFSSDSSRS